MKYTIVPVTAFAQNCTVLACEKTQAAAIVDPGGEAEKIIAVIEKLCLSPERVLLTHGHLDHVGAAQALAKHYAIPIYGPHVADAFWLNLLPQQAQMYGFEPSESFRPDHWLTHGEVVAFGQETLKVRHTPGHTPGHVIFYHAASKLALVGDVLFHGSIGRTDFPQGNHLALLRAIREQLWPLGKDTQFIPGHGPNSSFGVEMATNPYVMDE